MTPETETSAHYFFSTAVPSDAPAEVLEVILKGTLMAFEEDRVMIEAQQVQLLAQPEEPISIAGLAVDSPMIQMRGMLKKLSLSQEVKNAS